jgi:polyhydroxybutyrate depolymerase
MKRATLVVVLVALAATLARAEEGLEKREWTIKGVKREALVHVPAAATTTATPVLFAFHGHGGTAKNAARHWDYHSKWPEAIVVYPQGLDTPGRLTDPEGKKPGWQKTAGDQGDRDLALVDAILESLAKDCKLDEKRIFATGHSNGGGFTYLLWQTRGERFTAFAAVAAAHSDFAGMKPRPAMHVAGTKDPLVPLRIQERTMSGVQKLDECDEKGQPWGKAALYASKIGAPFVAFVHEGGHEVPEGAPDLIVKFFRDVVK